jgi:hypothetical protein
MAAPNKAVRRIPDHPALVVMAAEPDLTATEELVPEALFEELLVVEAKRETGVPLPVPVGLARGAVDCPLI